MSYVISSRKLKVDFREKHIHALLDLYLAGEDIQDSPVAEWGRRTLKAGGWWYGVEKLPVEQQEDGIQQRQKDIIALYKVIKKHGYTGSVVSIYFDKQTGQVHVYDGFHRLSIIHYLGREYLVNCKISYHHPTREDMRGDFPLQKRLIELNGRKVLYQPIDDIRLKDWRVWRPDSQKRLNIILESLISGSVLDVGCETGWFSRELSRRGYNVTGIDSNNKRVSIARYLNTISDTNVELCSGYWHVAIQDKKFDNILMLSVFHHDILAAGLEAALKRLETLREKCKRLIIEFPLRADLVKWLPENKKGLWSFTEQSWIRALELHTEMIAVDVQRAQLKDRPIITLVNPE